MAFGCCGPNFGVERPVSPRTAVSTVLSPFYAAAHLPRLLPCEHAVPPSAHFGRRGRPEGSGPESRVATALRTVFGRRVSCKHAEKPSRHIQWPLGRG
jgi:hypothetical protein